MSTTNQGNRKKRRRKKNFALRIVLYIIILGVFGWAFIKLATGLIYTYVYGNTEQDHNIPVTEQETESVDSQADKPDKGSKGYIVIDPGHGGEDSPGCIYGGLMERDLTLEVAFQLQKDLLEAGYTVLMTRKEDKSVELSERTKIANESSADLFISIHLNAHDNTSVSGIETWYNPDVNPNSSILAQEVQQSISAITKAKDRGIYSNKTLVVIRDTLIPSCLVEVGYLSNQSEREKICTEAYRKQLSQGIIDGIDQYFKQYPPKKAS